ncbi:MAG: hypothetical protein Q8N99_02105 [Nanoarchaeota archaeon]|nr:hypothetical protein [Nanoarchaeota archaeon]
MKSWLKFGIIFSLIPIIFLIYIWIYGALTHTTFHGGGLIFGFGGNECPVYSWIFGDYPEPAIMKDFYVSSCISILISNILVTIIFSILAFFIGLIIGLTYDKIKETQFWHNFKKGFFISIFLYFLISILFWIFADCSKIVGQIAPKVDCINNINYFKMTFNTEFILVFPIILILIEIGSFIYMRLFKKK